MVPCEEGRATRVVTMTSGFKDNLISRDIPSHKIDIIINGVDLQRYAPRPRDHALTCEWEIAEDDLVVGYIGTLGMAHALQTCSGPLPFCRTGK